MWRRDQPFSPVKQGRCRETTESPAASQNRCRRWPWWMDRTLHLLLVGGLEHEIYVPQYMIYIYGMSSFPLTNAIIFEDGYCTTNQLFFPFTWEFHQPKWRRNIFFRGVFWSEKRSKGNHGHRLDLTCSYEFRWILRILFCNSQELDSLDSELWQFLMVFHTFPWFF